MENQLPDFLIIPSIIIKDDTLQPLDGYVYGVIYWYTKLKLEKCIASSETIAEILHSTEGGVQNSINRLVRKKYIKSIYDRSSHKRELIPLVSFDKKEELEIIDTKTSNDVVAPHQMMESTTSNDGYTTNKNIKKEYINNTVNIENGIKKLPDINTDTVYIDYLTNFMTTWLNDEKSKKFYTLVAAKIPENVIRQTLSEIKVDGAIKPAAVFTDRIKKYAISKL